MNNDFLLASFSIGPIDGHDEYLKINYNEKQPLGGYSILLDFYTEEELANIITNKIIEQIHFYKQKAEG